MPHVNNLNFPEYMFALSFLHTIEDTFGKRKPHKLKEPGIPRESINLVSSSSTKWSGFFKECSFEEECISPEKHYRKVSAFCTGFYGNRNFDFFQNKPYLINSAVTL